MVGLYIPLSLCYYRRKPLYFIYILDSSISSKSFFVEVQQESSRIDPVLPQDQT
jgi:hypothetical protein